VGLPSNGQGEFGSDLDHRIAAVKLNVHFEAVETVETHLAQLESSLGAMPAILKDSIPRSDVGLCVESLARRMTREAARLRRSLADATDVLAWCARNQFELHLTLRYVLHSRENLAKWIAQRVTDEASMIEGILGIVESDKEHYAHGLRERLRAITQRGSELGLKPTKPIHVDTMASVIGLRADYDAFYKTYSKYVHPSSWVINASADEVERWDIRNLFLILAQHYGWANYDWLGKCLIGFKADFPDSHCAVDPPYSVITELVAQGYFRNDHPIAREA
jgi:hypothetical protein